MTTAPTQPQTSDATKSRKLRNRLIGMVTADKVNKTRKVVFEYLARHAKYNKYVKRQTVLHVHDEKNESRVGDQVEVMSCRPISKTKTYRLVRIVVKGTQIDTSILEGEASKMFEKKREESPAAGETEAKQ
ncbi:MAG TPA: 30S ribosomal protein S17 [Phycisphaerae bacterium]|jgi:small subunit ribosomal protein S17|nr:30S ribosomal protein S17 [Phycisphaerae bacterium]